MENLGSEDGGGFCGFGCLGGTFGRGLGGGLQGVGWWRRLGRLGKHGWKLGRLGRHVRTRLGRLARRRLLGW